MPHRLRLVVLALFTAALVAPRTARAEEARVRVLVPDGDNLQYLAFWVARGAGYFEAEGIAVDLVVPPKPALAQSVFTRGETEVAVLSPPMYLRLIVENFPFLLVANLLSNDPIDLVVRRSIAQARGIDSNAPIADRLNKMHGLNVGIAPGPPTRMRVLFASQGMSADRDVTMITIPGPEQNDAFGERRVDALYAHTPYLERALLDQDAVVVVDQPGGEVPELAHRQIHVLAVTRAYAATHEAIVSGMVRAIARAETLVHADPPGAVTAVLHALPSYDLPHVTKLVALYAPAVPSTPHVSADGFAAAIAFYPAGQEPPDLSRIDTAAFVAPAFAERASFARDRVDGRGARRAWPIYTMVLLGLAIAIGLGIRETFFSDPTPRSK